MPLVLSEEEYEHEVNLAPECPVCMYQMLPASTWKGEPMMLYFMCQNDHSNEEYDEVCHG